MTAKELDMDAAVVKKIRDLLERITTVIEDFSNRVEALERAIEADDEQ